MMRCISLFCLDVREETGGTHSVIGVLPDNVQTKQLPFFFPKVAVYTRVYLSIDEPPSPIRIILRDPEGEQEELAKIDMELVKGTIETARKEQSPSAGLISTASRVGFSTEKLGRFCVDVEKDGIQIVSGSLNFKMAQSK